MDFVKSGCEKSLAEVQTDSFSFECRGCTRMKELELELEQLRGQWIKWGKTTREMLG